MIRLSQDEIQIDWSVVDYSDPVRGKSTVLYVRNHTRYESSGTVSRESAEDAFAAEPEFTMQKKYSIFIAKECTITFPPIIGIQRNIKKYTI